MQSREKVHAALTISQSSTRSFPEFSRVEVNCV
jgi:hypothetical protein